MLTASWNTSTTNRLSASTPPCAGRRTAFWKASVLMMLACCSVAGCANPSIVRVDKSSVASAKITKVYVTRFEGNPSFVEESTDMFVAELEGQTSVAVEQGDVLRTESTDVLAGGNLAPTDLAIAAAKRVGAQAVIMGKVDSYGNGVTLNGFATVRVIDVSSGKVLASFHRPGGGLIANSQHQAVLSAVKRTADDVAGILR